MCSRYSLRLHIPASTTHVDPGSISALGITKNGKRGVAAAAGDHRIRAVATTSAVKIGDVVCLGYLGTFLASTQVAASEGIARHASAG